MSRFLGTSNSINSPKVIVAGNSFSGIFTHANTADRTYTLPDVTGTVALTSNIPTVNSGTLTLSIGTAAATNNTVTVGTGTGFNANTASNLTYSLSVGPALTALATTMTGATTGFLKKTAADTYTLDTASYQPLATILTTLSSLANSSGVLTNNGTGTLSWSSAGTGTVTSTQYKLSALNTAPTSSTDTGTLGEIRVTTDSIYVCTATNTWAAAEMNPWFTLTTTTTTANQVLATLSTSVTRSAEFLIQGVDSTGSKYQVTKIIATHNGTTADYSEYGSVQVGGVTGSFSIDVNAGLLRLLVTPASTNSTTFKVICITHSV